jgi:hypothetical protein
MNGDGVATHTGPEPCRPITPIWRAHLIGIRPDDGLFPTNPAMNSDLKPTASALVPFEGAGW